MLLLLNCPISPVHIGMLIQGSDHKYNFLWEMLLPSWEDLDVDHLIHWSSPQPKRDLAVTGHVVGTVLNDLLHHSLDFQ